MKSIRVFSILFASLLISTVVQANSPFVVAHRGDEQRYPENSVDAFLSSAVHKADYAEMDIRRTQDGVFVIHHDDHTGRSVQCDKGEVAIAQTTYDYLKTSCKYGEAAAGRNQVLTLAETLELMRWTTTGLVLDVKPVIKSKEMGKLAKELLALDPQGSCLKGYDPGGTFNCFSNIIIYVNDIPAHDKLWRMAKGLEKAKPAYRALGNMKFLKIVYSAKDALTFPEKYLDNDGIAFNLLNSTFEDTMLLRKTYPNKILAAWTLGNAQQFDFAISLGMDGVIVSHLHDYIQYQEAK